MGDIVMQVRRVTDLISEISAATTEQTTGIGQISDAVMQLDQVTQQNAALVEESAAAADSLSQQALRLVEAVGVFKLSSADVAGSAARVQPAPTGAVHKIPSQKPALQPLPKPALAATKKAAVPANGADGGGEWEKF